MEEGGRKEGKGEVRGGERDGLCSSKYSLGLLCLAL